MNSSASFQGYLEDFEGARTEAVAAIDAYAKSSSREQRETRVVAARSSVEEVERYLRVLENEAKSGATPTAKRMMEQVRHCRTQVSTLTAALNKELLVSDARAGGTSGVVESGNSKQQMERCAERLDRTGRHLDDAQRTLADTEAIAANVTTNLAQQRAQLEHVEMDVEQTREDTEEARGHLKQLACKVFSSRVLLGVVIVALAAAIALVSYYKWYPRDNKDVLGILPNSTSSA